MTEAHRGGGHGAEGSDIYYYDHMTSLGQQTANVNKTQWAGATVFVDVTLLKMAEYIFPVVE